MNNNNQICVRLMSMAERELGAFMSAVTELYGSEEGRISTEDWIGEFESLDHIPGSTTREWRRITIAAAARLANRLTEAGHCATGVTEKI